MPALLIQGLLAVAVVVDLAGALQRDLVVREGATLWSLGLRLRLRGRRLRDLVGVGGVSASGWSDHRGRIGSGAGIFSESGRVGDL